MAKGFNGKTILRLRNYGDTWPFPSLRGRRMRDRGSYAALWTFGDEGGETKNHRVSFMHSGHRGNIASFASPLSARQQSEAYRPFVTTSVPVFIVFSFIEGIMRRVASFPQNGEITVALLFSTGIPKGRRLGPQPMPTGSDRPHPKAQFPDPAILGARLPKRTANGAHSFFHQYRLS